MSRDGQQSSLKTSYRDASGGPHVVTGAAAAVFTGAACVSLAVIRRLLRQRDSLREELNQTHFRLRQTSSQVSELSVELEDAKHQLNSRTADLETTVKQLEARTAELISAMTALESARGELGLTKSRMNAIEKELIAAKRNLRTFQSQLEVARCDLEGARVGERSTLVNMWDS